MPIPDIKDQLAALPRDYTSDDFPSQLIENFNRSCFCWQIRQFKYNKLGSYAYLVLSPKGFQMKISKLFSAPVVLSMICSANEQIPHDWKKFVMKSHALTIKTNDGYRMPSDQPPTIKIQQRKHVEPTFFQKYFLGITKIFGNTIFMDNIVLHNGKIEKSIPLTALFTKVLSSPEINLRKYRTASEYLKDSSQLRIVDESITEDGELGITFAYDPKRCEIDEADDCIGVREYGAKSLKCKQDLVDFYITCHYLINQPQASTK